MTLTSLTHSYLMPVMMVMPSMAMAWMMAFSFHTHTDRLT